MSDAGDQVHFWNFLLQAAETLEASPDSEARETLLEQLVTLNEAFSGLADPVDHYESFVVLKLGAAIEACLRRSQAA
ncbi:MAG: hypothetical protein H7A05_01865 [Pseudomonadales bacterium]|nr:hypothetical protein [Pseudomonadales bacterium]MCP5331462.1 hypothetical protein [Pseudomonadales bacterium]MCP5343345.1 hypothetical protein [Pseudomonadales bacterium]